MEENNDQKEHIVIKRPLAVLTKIIVLGLIYLILAYVCAGIFKNFNIFLVVLLSLPLIAQDVVEAYVYLKYYNFDKNNKIVVRNKYLYYQINDSFIELSTETVLTIELYASNAIIYNTASMKPVDKYYYFKIFMKDNSVIIITSLIASTELIKSSGIKPIEKLVYVAFLPSSVG